MPAYKSIIVFITIVWASFAASAQQQGMYSPSADGEAIPFYRPEMTVNILNYDLDKPVNELNALASEHNFLALASAQRIDVIAPHITQQAKDTFACWLQEERAGLHTDKSFCKASYFEAKKVLSPLLQRANKQRMHTESRMIQHEHNLEQRGQYEDAYLVFQKRMNLGEMPKPLLFFFDLESDKFSRSGVQVVRDIAKEVQVYNPLKIIVSGHTDASGSKKYNFDLSRRRANNTAELLRRLGVKTHLFDVRIYGENGQRIPTRDGKVEQANRYAKIQFEKDNRIYYQYVTKRFPDAKVADYSRTRKTPDRALRKPHSLQQHMRVPR